MSRILSVYIDDETETTLTRAAVDLGRSVEDLAEAAVSESACNYRREEMKRADRTRADDQRITR